MAGDRLPELDLGLWVELRFLWLHVPHLWYGRNELESIQSGSDSSLGVSVNTWLGEDNLSVPAVATTRTYSL